MMKERFQCLPAKPVGKNQGTTNMGRFFLLAFNRRDNHFPGSWNHQMQKQRSGNLPMIHLTGSIGDILQPVCHLRQMLHFMQSGSPRHTSYSSRNVSKEDSLSITDDAHRRKNNSRDLNQTYGRNARSGDSYRHGRHSSRGFHDHRKHDDYRDDVGRDISKLLPRANHDTRDGRERDFDCVKSEKEYKMSRDADRSCRTRDIYDGSSYKSKHTERELPSLSMEKDRYTREKNARNETRGSRSTQRDNRTDQFDGVDYPKSTREDRKRSEYPENKLTRERGSRASREGNEDEHDFRSRRLASPSKKAKLANEHSHGTFSKSTTQLNSVNDVDNSNNLDAAKVAAMRAAELVNKNLVEVGVAGALSTDQKKKLLWGSKKKAVEESGHCWDASLFPDREQQEKFNRLMGVKGEVKAESKGMVDAEKQKELQLDLEKQYTAGLRRRDGRTVGLGL
ncbi:unnamed protein product [Rhodiola kirilowii]